MQVCIVYIRSLVSNNIHYLQAAVAETHKSGVLYKGIVSDMGKSVHV